MLATPGKTAVHRRAAKNLLAAPFLDKNSFRQVEGRRFSAAQVDSESEHASDPVVGFFARSAFRGRYNPLLRLVGAK